jgi:transposase
MRSYSVDLRERVVAAVERGTKRLDVVEAFGVSLPTIKRWLKQRRETGGLAPKPIPGPPALKRDALLEALPARLAEHADATLEAHCSWWGETAGVEVSTATMSRAITALDWTRKKRRCGRASATARAVGLGAGWPR